MINKENCHNPQVLQFDHSNEFFEGEQQGKEAVSRHTYTVNSSIMLWTRWISDYILSHSPFSIWSIININCIPLWTTLHIKVFLRFWHGTTFCLK